MTCGLYFVIPIPAEQEESAFDLGFAVAFDLAKCWLSKTPPVRASCEACRELIAAFLLPVAYCLPVPACRGWPLLFPVTYSLFPVPCSLFPGFTCPGPTFS